MIILVPTLLIANSSHASQKRQCYISVATDISRSFENNNRLNDIHSLPNFKIFFYLCHHSFTQSQEVDDRKSMTFHVKFKAIFLVIIGFGCW